MDAVMQVCWGYQVRTSSVHCIEVINCYCHEVLSNGRENNCIFKAPEYDPECVLGNTLAAYVSYYSDRSRRPPSIDVAKAHLQNATSYEKAVFKAVNHLISTGDEDEAVELHVELLRAYPKDILSLKRAQVLCFFMGASKRFLTIVEEVMSPKVENYLKAAYHAGVRALTRNEEHDAIHHAGTHSDDEYSKKYIHGIHAFALQEVGGKDHLKAAEEAGQKGLEINPVDAANHHALCHIYQHDCRFVKAVEFMEERSKTWTDLQSFMFTHNWWHVCLCYFEGNAHIKYVWKVHEEKIWKELEKKNASRGKVYLNAIGLLLRVHIRSFYHEALRGYEPSMLQKHLDTLTKSLMEIDLHSIWKREWFLDILLLWVLSHMKKHNEAQELLQALKSKIDCEKHEKKRERMKKGYALAQASYKYGKGEYQEALELLGANFDAVDYKVIGASGEQIDVFTEVYIDLLLKTKDAQKAIPFVFKQMSGRSGAPFLWRLMSEAVKMLESEYKAKGKTDKETIEDLDKYAAFYQVGALKYERFNHLT